MVSQENWTDSERWLTDSEGEVDIFKDDDRVYEQLMTLLEAECSDIIKDRKLIAEDIDLTRWEISILWKSYIYHKETWMLESIRAREEAVTLLQRKDKTLSNLLDELYERIEKQKWKDRWKRDTTS